MNVKRIELLIETLKLVRHDDGDARKRIINELLDELKVK